MGNRHRPSGEGPPQPPEITAEQWATADFFITEAGLGNVAGAEISMYGQTGSVRFGLARCADHLMDMTPDEVRDFVDTKLKDQQRPR